MPEIFTVKERSISAVMCIQILGYISGLEYRPFISDLFYENAIPVYFMQILFWFILCECYSGLFYTNVITRLKRFPYTIRRCRGILYYNDSDLFAGFIAAVNHKLCPFRFTVPESDNFISILNYLQISFQRCPFFIF